MIAASMSAFDSSLERALFDSSNPETIAARLEQHLERLEISVVAALFYRSGVGLTVGLRLSDGREVVLKVHRWNVTFERLRNVQRVQRTLGERLAVAPMPLADPTELAAGFATLEQYRPANNANGHVPAVRRNIAVALNAFVEAAHDVAVIGLGAPVVVNASVDPLWPEPHSVRFDFAGSAEGADWIDHAAIVGRARLLRFDSMERTLR